jgi:SAM-dependent methyltransferase
VNEIGSPLSLPESGTPGSVEATRRLLDELAVLIEQIEISVEQGVHGALPSLIAANAATTRRIMEGIGTIFHTVSISGEPPEVADQVRELATARLGAWSSTSPVFYRILHTPRESFDEFEIIVLLLENRPAGGNVAAQILDHYYRNMVTSSSMRNRINQFVSQLADETRRRAAETHPIRILNLHTGACKELELLARNRPFAQAAHITCLDRDPTALRRARQRLGPLASQTLFVRADAREHLAARSWPEAPYDIIYTVNLFDQLDDQQTAKLIADCYKGLAPGGVLIFGNYSLNLPIHERTFIAWLMNWNIRCHPEEEWRQIFTRTWLDADCVRFESEELQASQLVIATHP